MLLDRLLHWRSNHGYGVHSPFAFSFITTVLRDPGCAFYAYGRLGKLKFESRTIARLLLRTAAAFNPREALIIGEATDSADAPLLLHDSRTRLVVSETVATSGIAPDKVTRAATFARALALYGERLDTAIHRSRRTHCRRIINARQLHTLAQVQAGGSYIQAAPSYPRPH